MNAISVVKTTLIHISGAVSKYAPETGSKAKQHGGVREAVISLMSNAGSVDKYPRMELLRADIAGANWTALERAGAVPELIARLREVARDLADGHPPHVVVTLDASRSIIDARFITNRASLAAELLDVNKRSLSVPSSLPYQLGGEDGGATAVIYRPAGGGGLHLHSMHSTAGEAHIVEGELRARGDTRTAQLKVGTSVTALLGQVLAGAYVAPTPLADSHLLARRHADRPNNRCIASDHPGLSRGIAGKPTPFGEM